VTTNRYTLAGLRKHTRSIRTNSSPISEEQRAALDRAVRDFDQYFAGLDEQTDNLRKNVGKLLATSFFNHWYAALLLAEAGLFVDAVLCERNALEVLAFHWLVCLDPVAANDYHDGAIPRPVVVRRRLEALGADITHVREAYASGSAISHVGRPSERFHLEWEDQRVGALAIGGKFNAESLHRMLEYLSALLYLFQKPLMVGSSDTAPGV
jgi:hypothetical protein